MSRLLKDLLAGLAPAPSDNPDLEVTGVETDSRRVEPGDAFLAVKGVAGHGLAHVETALARGAMAVVWEPAPGIAEPAELPVPQVAVPGLARRVGEIAARFHHEPARQLFTVGVTGTDGKTSSAYLVAQGLEALGDGCAYLGTIGFGRLNALREASHTTPDPIRLQELLAGFVAEGVQACAMEVSSHALHQARVSGIGYDVAILTNVTRDHLDYHGTVEAYAEAKRRLFSEYCRGMAVLNRDDARGAAWAAELLAEGRAVTVYGLDGEVPGAGRYLLGRQLQLSSQGLAMEIDSSWGQGRLETRLLGRFNAYNLLAALAALLQRGAGLADALRALSGVRTVPGRIEGYRGPAAKPLVVVDYAHTPEALEQILKAVRAHTAGRLICVFGCGGDRDRGKRPLMGQAAVNLADAVIVTDDNPRSEDPVAIAEDIQAGIRLTPNASRLAAVIHDRAEAIRAAVAGAAADDVVVVAGKGHESTQTYGRDVRAFSDRAFVKQLVEGNKP